MVNDIKNVFADVHATLAANKSGVKKRRDSIAELAGAIKSLQTRRRQGEASRLMKRPNVWFATNQTNSGKRHRSIHLQILGANVGTLKQVGRAFRFSPNKSTLAKIKKTNPDIGLTDEAEGWAWTGNANACAKTDKYLRECKNLRAGKLHDEREIQWQLADALRGRKSGLAPALALLAPVTWDGLFTEIGTSINKDGKARTGNIDLMVRSGKGPNTQFLVFEVKAPKERDWEKALLQALRYASAIKIEANGFDGDESSSQNLKNYRAVLGAGGERKLNIGAVIVMRNPGDKQCEKIAQRLEQYFGNHSDNPIKPIGVLFYEFEGKAVGWKWLSGWKI